MKSFIKKIICSFILILLLINSNLLLIISNAIEEVNNEESEKNVQAIADMQLEKYYNYKLSEEKKGILVQVNLKTGIKYNENQEYKPLKSTEVVLTSPKIEGKYPQNIEVVAKSTKATNGKENNIQANYEYSNENGELKIYTSNEADENGNIYNQNVENALDEYKILYYYDKNSYNAEEIERNIEINANIKEKIYDENESEIETQCHINENVTKNIGNIIDSKITTNEIYNGYIYANSVNGTKNQTEYIENTELEVSYKEISDEIIIDSNNQFINNREEEIATNEIIYKSTKIKKEEIINLLGEDGKVQVLNENNEVISEINKDTQETDNGIVEVKYDNEISKIIIKITKPLKVGYINIQNTKAIKETMTEIKNQKIKALQTIKAINNIQEKNEKTQEVINEYEEEVYESNSSNIAEIKNAQTSIDLKMDKTELTNKVQNDVTLTATLLTNSAKYNLYKDPTILITLPSEVDSVILGETSLLYDENLYIDSAQVVDNEGIKSIQIKLKGTQNSYTDNLITEGVNILIPTTIILKKDIQSVNSSIQTRYSNETGIINDYANEGKEYKETNVKIESMLENKSNLNMTLKSGIETNLIQNGLQFEITASVGDKELSENDIIHEHEIIKYTIKVKNITNSDINNVRIEGNIPKGTSYATISRGDGNNAELTYTYVKDDSVDKYKENIDTVKANTIVEKYYEVEVNELEESKKEESTENIIKIYNNDNEIYSKSIVNIIKEGKLTVRVQSCQYQAEEYGWSYAIWIYNNTNEDINNVTAICELPEELEIIEKLIYFSGGSNSTEEDITEENGKITIKLDKINANDKADIILTTRQVNMKENIYEYNLKMSAKVNYDNDEETYWSNENREISYIEGIEVIQTSEQEGKELEYGDEVEYNIKVKNVGNSNQNTYTIVNITDFLPEDIEAISAEYKGFVVDENGEISGQEDKVLDLSSKFIPDGVDGDTIANIDINTIIPMGEEINIKIKAKAGVVNEKKEISNIVTVSGDNIETKVSNTIKFLILPAVKQDDNTEDNGNNGENNEDNNGNNNNNNSSNNGEDNNKVNKISGLVWIDSNENGKRDSDENIVQNVTVKLYNIQTNAIVKGQNGESKMLSTDQNGKYEFSEIGQGKYLVLFEYDSNNYKLTAYQKFGVNEQINSDVIKKEVNIDGIKKIVGVTDTINIENSNVEHIDMGLIKNSTYDLSLEKYVSKITVKSDKGTKEYTYDNYKLAKVEIPSKEINNAILNIEYKIVVKNEGDVEAYVSEVTDYLPNELRFDNTLNKSWSKVSNNSLVNKELAKKRILPGESQEILLILTKDMTEDSTGTITNGAEITKSNNTYGLSDRDSTENNKNIEEDDYSEAQVIISVGTGIISYSLFILFLLALLIIIRKVIIDKKIKLNYKSLTILVMTIVSLSLYFTQTVSDASVKSNLKDELEEQYKKSGTISVNSGSSNFSTHKDALEDYLNKEKYHCEDGSKSMCGSSTHTYKQKSVSVTCVEDKKSTSKSNSFTKDDSRVKLQSYDNTYNILGPYKINKVGKLQADPRCTAIYNENGQNIVGSCHVEFNGFNNDFYIKIPKNVYKIKSVKFSIISETTEYYQGVFKIVEHWTCSSVGSGYHGGYKCNNKANCQPLKRVRQKTIDREEEGIEEKSLTLAGATLPTGSLTINKKDYDTGANLTGADFIVIGPLNCAWSEERRFDSITSPYTISKLPYGTYRIIETGAPKGYDNFQVGQEAKATINANNKNSSVTIINRQYGDLLVRKVDQTTQTPLEGVKFKISYYEKGIRYYIKKYLPGEPSKIESTTNIREAKEFISGEDGYGRIYLTNIPIYTYYIEEVGFVEKTNLSNYYNSGIVLKAKIKPHSEKSVSEFVMANKQEYVDLSGYIWEDIISSKSSTHNYLYKEGESDKEDKMPNKISGIKVRLINKSTGNVVINKNGNRCESNSTNYLYDGTYGYKFSSVPIYDSSGTLPILGNYYLEFEYNGLKYKSVPIPSNYTPEEYLKKANSSKVQENSNERKSFNEEYTSISGSSTKGSTTIGYSEKGNQKTNKLVYDSEDIHTSQIVQKTDYSSQNSHVQSQGNSKGIKMTANTKNSGYTIRQYEGNPLGQKIVKEIKNINLGLVEREQPDLAIQNDIAQVKMELNGYTHLYNYSQKDKYISSNTNSNGKLIIEGEKRIYQCIRWILTNCQTIKWV